MTLPEYIAAHNLKPKDLAAQLRVTSETVRRYLNGSRKPDDEMMVRIFEVTGGKVQPNDFFGVGSRRNGRAA